MTKQKLPITFNILQKLQDSVLSQPDVYVTWAAMTFAFFGCLRAAELTIPSQLSFNPLIHICLSDVLIHDETNNDFVSVFIKRSKTDISNVGFHVYIGCSNHKVCGHCSLKYLVTRCVNYSDEPKRQNSPLFMYSNGVILTKHLFVTQTKLALVPVGYHAGNYSGHSFRSGSATSAAAAGLADWEIKLLGRWSSQAYQRYIRTPEGLLTSFSKRIIEHQTFNKVFNYRNPYIANMI